MGEYRTGGFTGNELKVMAAVSMFLDHLGYFVYPEFEILRVFGRLSFPIFAFFIYQGTKYTKNKFRYFSTMFLMGIVGMAGLWWYAGILYGNILITFSLSVLLIYSVQRIKALLDSKISILSSSAYKEIMLFLFLMYIIERLCQIIVIDYGFIGILVPVVAAAVDKEIFYGKRVSEGIGTINTPVSDEYKSNSLAERGVNEQRSIGQDTNSARRRINRQFVLAAFGVMLFVLAERVNYVQYFGLFALVPLYFYNGTVGTYKMKYFFYWFYPLHFVVVAGINYIVNGNA